ncbi:MAG: uracil-DNA glycosylase [Armatimonadota bacterium]|jgi:uracil-DNA glycosylase
MQQFYAASMFPNYLTLWLGYMFNGRGLMRISRLSVQAARFVDDLAACQVPPNACNQYSYDEEANAVRRDNLILYLRQMAERSPGVLLVGEAAGYHGCRLTGVPFTSEDILLCGIPKFGLFGSAHGYRTTGDSSNPCKERTASMVWAVLSQLDQPPMLWNAYPFHPFIEGMPCTNRPPTSSEIRTGKAFLTILIEIASIRTIIAVGKKAGEALTDLGVRFYLVRHPSHGGRKEFASGIADIMEHGR